MTATSRVTRWLLEGDPAIRWQTMRDLTGASETEVEAERARVATEGWGARLLAEQDPDGRWGGGLYSPKWVSTTYTLLLLERLGLATGHGAAAAGTELLMAAGFSEAGGVTLWPHLHPDGEMCVTGMCLKLVTRFLPDDDRRGRIVDFIRSRRMEDGGWNCDDVRRNATHSSLHTTISVLEGLATAGAAGSPGCDELLASGHEFLLRHRLYRSHTTGEIIRADMTRFSFPPRWWFDVLRGLDHFAAVDHPYDKRLEDAVALVESKRLADGTWKLQNRRAGRTFFEMEEVGKPSRWNTLRALRVLRWWAGHRPPTTGSR